MSGTFEGVGEFFGGLSRLVGASLGVDDQGNPRSMTAEEWNIMHWRQTLLSMAQMMTYIVFAHQCPKRYFNFNGAGGGHLFATSMVAVGIMLPRLFATVIDAYNSTQPTTGAQQPDDQSEPGSVERLPVRDRRQEGHTAIGVFSSLITVAELVFWLAYFVDGNVSSLAPGDSYVDCGPGWQKGGITFAVFHGLAMLSASGVLTRCCLIKGDSCPGLLSISGEDSAGRLTERTGLLEESGARASARV